MILVNRGKPKESEKNQSKSDMSTRNPTHALAWMKTSAFAVRGPRQYGFLPPQFPVSKFPLIAGLYIATWRYTV
jgi:hypothetical protein